MNIATNSLQKLTQMLVNADRKLKEYGKEPYGQRKLTDREQRERVENLTQEELMAMIEEHGVESTNEWLSKYWEG